MATVWRLTLAVILLALWTLVLWSTTAVAQRAPMLCLPAKRIMTDLDKIGETPGYDVTILDQQQTKTFLAFANSVGLSLQDPDRFTQSILVEVQDHIIFVLIRKDAPTHCMSPGFNMPKEIAQPAMRAVFGQPI